MGGDRYLKSENETLCKMYPTATKAEILAEMPGRNWLPLSAHARRNLGLHRTREAKWVQIQIGRKRIERT